LAERIAVFRFAVFRFVESQGVDRRPAGLGIKAAAPVSDSCFKLGLVRFDAISFFRIPKSPRSQLVSDRVLNVLVAQ